MFETSLSWEFCEDSFRGVSYKSRIRNQGSKSGTRNKAKLRDPINNVNRKFRMEKVSSIQTYSLTQIELMIATNSRTHLVSLNGAGGDRKSGAAGKSVGESLLDVANLEFGLKWSAVTLPCFTSLIK